MPHDIDLVVGVEGGIPQHDRAFTTIQKANARARRMAKSYRLPLHGEHAWHDEDNDVSIETVRVDDPADE